jgi:zinc transporter
MVTGMNPLLTALGPEDAGLICAFELAPVVARGVDVLAEPGSARPLWLHFSLTPVRAERWLRDEAPIPEEARAELTDDEPRIHVRLLSQSLVAVLGDLEHDLRDDSDDFSTVRIYVDTQRMISARRRPLKTADVVRRELRAGLEIDSPMALFETFVEKLAETFAHVVDRLGEKVDDAEDLILAGRFEDQGTVLGRVRRFVARLRRHLNANRSALAPLPARLPDCFDGEHKHSLHRAIEHLDAVAQDLELVQERTRLLQEEIAGRVGEMTNRNLFWLSIVTTVLLPVTLVTGIFGMNVHGLPFAESEGGFWWVLLVMVGIFVLVLFVLRRRRLF